MPRITILTIVLALITAAASAQLPPPPKDLANFPFSFAPDAPGALAADSLLDKPAGRLGPVVVKGDHFYTGDKRIRFWGVNFAFSACFPTHAQADQVAARLASEGNEVVYVSGEESAEQVRLRAVRLGLGGAPVRLAAAS